ncbi:MAG: hypothetical protein AVDCRST_MAG68-922, partial [uncultured Gemmatimonadetes bacterium]
WLRKHAFAGVGESPARAWGGCRTVPRRGGARACGVYICARPRPPSASARPP